jgi:tyrosine aminotransferase
MHARLVYECLKTIPGLNPIMPKGSMYMMIGIKLDNFPQFESSLSFMRHLAMEQSVFTLPSEGFNYPGFLRIVLTAPQNILEETCERMKEFCEKHYQETK